MCCSLKWHESNFASLMGIAYEPIKQDSSLASSHLVSSHLSQALYVVVYFNVKPNPLRGLWKVCVGGEGGVEVEKGEEKESGAH